MWEAFGGRFKQIGVKEPLVDVHSFRHTITTILADAPGLDNGWIDEITGHASKEPESESTRYTKKIYLSNLKAALSEGDILSATALTSSSSG